MAASPTRDRNPDTPNMVLRTVYFPIGMDEDLKNAALLSGRSKNDLIRELVSAGLAGGTVAAKALARARERTIAPVEVKPAVRTISKVRQVPEEEARDGDRPVSTNRGARKVRKSPPTGSEDFDARVAKAIKAARARKSPREAIRASGLKVTQYAKLLLTREEASEKPRTAAKKPLRYRHGSKLGTGKKGSRPGKGLRA